MYPVWSICMDGPCAGFVFESHHAERLVEVQLDGTHQYRRRGWTPPAQARIALYFFTKSLVI